MNSEIDLTTLNVRPSPRRTNRRAARSLANAVPWRLAHRDNLVAKAPGLVTGGLNRRQRFLPIPAGRYAAITFSQPFTRLRREWFAAGQRLPGIHWHQDF